jgi:hypothetical protein
MTNPRSYSWSDIAIVREDSSCPVSISTEVLRMYYENPTSFDEIMKAAMDDSMESDSYDLPDMMEESDESESSDSDSLNDSLDLEDISLEEISLEQAPSATKAWKRHERRRVQFSSVQIREYSCTIGDHPRTDMYPLSLDWAHTPTKTIPFDQYEQQQAASSPAPANENKVMLRKRLRLTIMDRVSRLIDVTGRTSADLYAQEHRRQIKAHQEKIAMGRGIILTM